MNNDVLIQYAQTPNLTLAYEEHGPLSGDPVILLHGFPYSPRGVEGLTANRRSLCELLWTLWSPTWAKGPELYPLTAPAFDNPDFVEVVIHSYRHRFMYAPGDPALEWMEQALTRQPAIRVPTISLCGADDGVGPAPEIDEDIEHFTGQYQRRVLPGVGHNIPEEAPAATLKALLDLLQH